MSLKRQKSSVQSVIFERFMYTPITARKWLSNNNFSTIGKVRTLPTQLIYTIKKRQGFKRFFSKQTSRGITLVIGFKNKTPISKSKKTTKSSLRKKS